MLHTAHTITAHFVAKSGQEDGLYKALAALIAPSRAEAGCLLYTLHQSTENKGEFLIYEAWVDTKAHALHRETPHYHSFRQVRDTLVEKAMVNGWQAMKTAHLGMA